MRTVGEIQNPLIEELRIKKMNCVIYRLTNHWLMMGALLLCIFSFLFITTPPSVRGEKEWYPVEVDVWNPPFNDQRQREQKRYTPLDKVQKMRRIRVFIPHLKDAYWMGVN
jgi:protein TorT